MMVAEVMIRIGCNSISAKSLKTSAGVGGGAAPPMMFEELMIQLGVQLNLCRTSKT